MADNVTIPASGTGDATPVVATDDVAGAHYQRVKLDLGDDGLSDPAIGTVPVSGTVTVAEPVTVDGAVEVSNFPATQPVSGTVAVTHAALTELAAAIDTELQVDIVGALPAGNANIGDVDVASIAAGDNNIGNVDVVTMPTVTINAIPAGTNNIGDVDIASSVVLTTKQASSTGTLANVASSASSVTLLASNASRLGATIHNDSTQILYVKFGTTASATSYTVKMVADAYYECPFGYTGRIDGIWASANGNARVTELT
jgi:hypothetical protein